MNRLIIPSITSQRVIVIVLLLFVALVGSAALAYQNHKLDSRIDALETELASRPAIGDMIDAVVAWGLENMGSAEFCVRYHASDSVEETCVPAGLLEKAAHCAAETKAGKPLPDACH